MAILKQNGVNGKILRSNDGSKVMKQNYNFGLKSNITSRTYYLEIPNLIGEDVSDWSFSMWGTNNGDANRHPKFYCANSDLTKQVDVFEQMSIFPNDGFKTGYADGASGTTGLSAGKHFRSINCAYTTPFLINQIYIAKGGVRAADTATSDLDDLLIYNRNITKSEHDYIYNLGRGNLPMSLGGLMCYINFDDPQIIGSDVGHLDISGNGNNALYRGLPAGTLQEQLDFVISNLLTTW